MTRLFGWWPALRGDLATQAPQTIEDILLRPLAQSNVSLGVLVRLALDQRLKVAFFSLSVAKVESLDCRAGRTSWTGEAGSPEEALRLALMAALCDEDLLEEGDEMAAPPGRTEGGKA